ncbi:Six-hairpin glycosidase [Hysterangium stoloniferum]|nr:Six-hairpin glycosidase [Hysterangium stoloniferum]
MLTPIGKTSWPWLAPLACLLCLSRSFAQKLTDDQLAQVTARLAEGATMSWEIGTRAQALTELNAPFYSVFSNTPLPPPISPPSSSTNLTEVISIAIKTISQPRNTTGPQPLIANDGAAGDPASIGVSVLLANWTMARASGNRPDFTTAAAGQLDFLLTSVPRTSDGAISHRVSHVQLWSDFVYMAPPFLAYYGVMTQNKSLVAESYNQIRLYRNYLRDPTVSLWRHIVMGSGDDPGHWSTGNAWAAAGMLRVLATIKHSNMANQFRSEQIDIQNWVIEILDGMYSYTNGSHLFHNYADNSSTFIDASSTALLAASTYRLALLTQTYHNLPHAEDSRKTLVGGDHFDSYGWLQPVVNPLNWSMSGSQSPEAQAFVVEMQAAWRDWVAIGSPVIGHKCNDVF